MCVYSIYYIHTTYKFGQCTRYNIHIRICIQSVRERSEIVRPVCTRASLPVIYLHNIIRASTHLLHARRFMAKLIDLFRFLMAYARALRRTRHVHRQYYKYIIIGAANGYEHNLEKTTVTPPPLLPRYSQDWPKIKLVIGDNPVRPKAEEEHGFMVATLWFRKYTFKCALILIFNFFRDYIPM